MAERECSFTPRAPYPRGKGPR